MLRAIPNIPKRFWYWLSATFARSAQNVGTAFIQIRVNLGRSFLTTLGIIIAVASIITVVAFVQGFGNHMSGMLQGYGTRYMMVRPWWPRVWGPRPNVKLDLRDIEAVRTECARVHRITPFAFDEARISYANEYADDVSVRGVNEQYQTIRNFFVDEGRFFGPLDVDNAANVVVLGRTLLKSLQCDESIVGDYVYINDARFRVIGLLEPKGSFMGDDQDETVMIPYTTAVRLNPRARDLMPFLVEAAAEEHIDELEAQITRVLRRRHGLRGDDVSDFTISRQDQMLRQFDTVTNVASAMLAGVVSISLLVGGIGIMNVMLVSVTERTYEIGLRKSVGARRRDIMLQFLTEAVVLCTFGGLIGVGLGYAIAQIASLHPRMVEVVVPWWAVALALGFSAGAGLLFGIIPAFKAAVMHPIDALRHE